MKKIIVAIIILAINFVPLKLSAWGTTGHRIIAEIAERNLNKKTKKQIKKLLDDYPMAYWSNWADNVRSDTTDRWKHTYVWHYVNVPSGLEKQQLIEAVNRIEQDNVYREIPELSKIIKSNGSTDEDKRIALYFLIHLVGDLHQPMHVGHEDDLGGNRVTVYWFDKLTNIHAVWDSNLIDYEKYSYTEYADILNILTKKEKQNLQSGVLDDWLFQTYEITTEIYASVNKDDKLSYGYPYKYKETVELQLQRAGLRLAGLLNQIFR